MKEPVANFNFHDAIIEYFCFDAVRSRLETYIWEDVRHSTRTVRKKFVFAEVINWIVVQQFHERIKGVLRKEKRRELNYWVNDFRYCDTTVSKRNDLHLKLEVDHLGVLIINCRKFKIYDVNSTGEEELAK